MRSLPRNPDAADEAPVAEAITPYDLQHLVTYLRLLDAGARGVDWLEGARPILHIDPSVEPARAWLSWESHMRRALWMTQRGHRLLVRLSEAH